MKAVVLAGGDIRVTPGLKRSVQGAELVAAADSGLRHAAPLGLVPDVVLGDFDSVAPEDLAHWPGVPRLAHPPEKDWLDLELALHYVRERGADDIVLVGGLGGRFDQSLAAVLIAARMRSEGFGIRLDSGDRQLYVLSGDDRLELELPAGRRFSVIGLAPASTVSITNAKYPLQDHRLVFGVGLGVSNEAARSPLKVALAGGLAVVTVE